MSPCFQFMNSYFAKSAFPIHNIKVYTWLTVWNGVLLEKLTVAELRNYYPIWNVDAECVHQPINGKCAEPETTSEILVCLPTHF
jgi:hypothetical protein